MHMSKLSVGVMHLVTTYSFKSRSFLVSSKPGIADTEDFQLMSPSLGNSLTIPQIFDKSF